MRVALGQTASLFFLCRPYAPLGAYTLFSSSTGLTQPLSKCAGANPMWPLSPAVGHTHPLRGERQASTLRPLTTAWEKACAEGRVGFHPPVFFFFSNPSPLAHLKIFLAWRSEAEVNEKANYDRPLLPTLPGTPSSILVQRKAWCRAGNGTPRSGTASFKLA